LSRDGFIASKARRPPHHGNVGTDSDNDGQHDDRDQDADHHPHDKIEAVLHSLRELHRVELGREGQDLRHPLDEGAPGGPEIGEEDDSEGSGDDVLALSHLPFLARIGQALM
jgi:hypothetical protein